jgi:hypothetical protein
VVALWEDIRTLDRKSLDAFLDEAGKTPAVGTKKAATRPSKKRVPQPADDRPATIIVHQLSVLAGFDDKTAKSRVRAALLARGISDSDIPRYDETSLHDWVTGLISNVSAALVSAEAEKLIGPKS